MHTQPLYCSLSFAQPLPPLNFQENKQSGRPQDSRRSLLYFSLPETTVFRVHLSYQGQQSRGPGLG